VIVTITTIIANLAPLALDVFDRLIKLYGKTKAQKEELRKLFYQVYLEITGSLTAFSGLKNGTDTFNKTKVNSADFKEFTGFFKTDALKQLYEYSVVYPGIQNKKNKALFSNIDFAIRKIDELRNRSQISASLQDNFKPVRIGVRLKNINKALVEIKRGLFKDNTR
jgi:hypothetical protein